MKDHALAIIETSAEYFSKGYNVYLEYKVYRFPNADSPSLRKRKYRIDVFAVKGQERLFVEVGYLPKRKMVDLKRLCPDVRLIRVLQWKNFSVHPVGGKKKPKTVRIKKPEYWTLERDLKLVTLKRDGLKNRFIAKYFKEKSIPKIAGRFYRLQKLDLLSEEKLKLFHDQHFDKDAWLLIDLYPLSRFNKRFKRKRRKSRISVKTIKMKTLTKIETIKLLKAYSEYKTLDEMNLLLPKRSLIEIEYLLNSLLIMPKRIPEMISPRFWNRNDDELLIHLCKTYRSYSMICNYFSGKWVGERIVFLEKKGFLKEEDIFSSKFKDHTDYSDLDKVNQYSGCTIREVATCDCALLLFRSWYNTLTEEIPDSHTVEYYYKQRSRNCFAFRLDDSLPSSGSFLDTISGFVVDNIFDSLYLVFSNDEE